MIVIVDYGMGNTGSIKNMIKKIGGESIVSSNCNDILAASKLVLPGVGAFDEGMKNLKDKGLIDCLFTKVINEKTPILGICLGMQLLTSSSEEGSVPGLGWINARAVKFDNTNLKVPHMGWNIVHPQKASKLFVNDSKEERFYFVHSYFVKCTNSEDILTTTYYGSEFVSSFEKENISGVQFHPEKSHLFGMNLLKKFVSN